MQGRRIKATWICPRCKGTGKSRAFVRNPKYSLSIRKKAQELYDKDWTFREIAEKLKIKHPQTVKNILSYNL